MTFVPFSSMGPSDQEEWRNYLIEKVIGMQDQAKNSWSYPDMRTKAGRSDVALDHRERAILRRLLLSEIDKFNAMTALGGWIEGAHPEEAITRFEDILLKLGCRKKEVNRG